MKVYRAKKASFALISGLVLFVLSGSIFGQNMFRKINDFDGDGKADYAITRNIGTSKYWYVLYSSSGSNVFQFGFDTDIETAGDWDGDGKTDYSIYRRQVSGGTAYHNFWVFGSLTNGVTGKQVVTWDQTGGVQVNCIPFGQVYNTAGEMQAAVAITNQPGNPYINIVNYYTTLKSYPIGNTPVRVGDMTGDGKADIVSYNSSNVVTINNYSTDTTQTVQFGTTGDQYVPADFDGDGKGDLAVFRESNGTWWWIRSSDGVINAAQFGQPGDKPVPADYDGDGKTDLAIWRPGASQSYYWVYGSLGNLSVVPFGIGTDKVVTY